MLKSDFVKNLLELLLDGDNEGDPARKQIPFLTENVDVEYTGVGAFYRFIAEKGIENYRLPPEGSAFLPGIEITSPELTTNAEAIVHFEKGIISSLEIWSHGGEYPKKELTSYRLSQLDWPGFSGKQIEVNTSSA